MSAINKSFNHFHSSYRRSHSTVLGNSVAKSCATGRHNNSHRKELYRLRTMSVSSDTANEPSRVTANSCTFKFPPRISSADDMLPVVSVSLSQPSTNLKTTSLLKKAVRGQHSQAGRASESTHSQHLTSDLENSTGFVGMCPHCEL